MLYDTLRVFKPVAWFFAAREGDGGVVGGRKGG